VHRTNFIPILLPFFLMLHSMIRLWCLLFYTKKFLDFFWRKYFVHLFNTKTGITPISCLFFWQYFVHFFFEGYILYTYLILKKCIAPISFLSCCLFFFQYFLHLFNMFTNRIPKFPCKFGYPNFHINLAIYTKP